MSQNVIIAALWNLSSICTKYYECGSWSVLPISTGTSYYYQQVYFSMGLCSGLEKSTWSTAQEMIHSPPYRFRCGLDRNLATIMKKCVVQYIHSSEKVHKHSYILLKSNCKRKQSVSSSQHIVSEEEKTHLWTVLGLINWKKVKIEPKIRK